VAELFDRLSLDGVVCMALMHAQEGNAEASSDALAACIDSGTPVAIWGRKWSADLQERREQIARLLADIRRLPEQVRDLRVAARGGGEEHPGHSLVLLWDDPNRLPPDALPVTQLVLPAP
jgi:hypothetical protein